MKKKLASAARLRGRLSSTRKVQRWLSRAVLCLAAGLGACGGGGGGGGGAAPGGSPAPGTAPPLISGFTPTSAAVGQSVTIEGLNFVAGQTTVNFNGVAATGVSAAPTQISVTVPAGATSGRISVGTAGGSATSSSDFTVLANSTTPGIAWTTRRLGAPTGAVAFGAGKFVSAGSDLATSTDLLIWTDRSSLANKEDVAWDGQKFVAVGMSTATSLDGLSWTSRSQAAFFTKEKVAASGSGWVAVGGDAGIEFSADGITWVDSSPSVAPGFNTLNQAVWTGNQWVVMGDSGLIFTSPDGTNWTPQTAGTTDGFTALAASPSLIVANTFPSGGSQQAFYTSSNGVSWTQRALGTAPFFRDMLRVETRWVGVGTFGGSSGAQWSDDGLTWTAATGQFDQTPDYVVHDGTRFVAFSSALSSSGETYVSPDGKSWTLMAPGDQKWIRMARSPAGLMVAISFGRVQTSTDGINWTYGVPPSTTSGLIDVEWFAPLNQFVALSQVAANAAVFFSPDGLNWTLGSSVASTHNRAIGASPTLLVNVPGFTGAGASIYTSPDGVNWTPRTNPATAGLNEVQWLGDRWIALGSSGAVLTSPDGISWTASSSGVTAALRRAVMVGGTITVVGDGGTILSSADGGASWIARTSNTVFSLKDIVWTGAEYVAVGGAGRVVRSTNGVTWSEQPTPYTQTLFATDPYNMNAALWTGSRIVVVGDRNLVATSP
jgi:hypothetical protein